jgi:predicted RNA-binding protein associated with RNAse of E/G family
VPREASTTERRHAPEQVIIHYRRPPDRTDDFVQLLVHESSEVIVTFLEHTPLAKPLVVNGDIVLENGSPAVWFTFPGARHDIGRFHTADGRFTGIYANILEPVEFVSRLEWRTTDLFLDVWIGLDGSVSLLDGDELARAEERGWVDAGASSRARAEADFLMAEAQIGKWPPECVAWWTLETVRGVLRD